MAGPGPSPAKILGGIRARQQTTLDIVPANYRDLVPKSDGWYDPTDTSFTVIHESRRLAKTTDTSRTSNVTVAADPDLTMTLGAGRYRIHGCLWITSGNVNPGFKMDLGSTWSSSFGLVSMVSNNGAVVQAAGSNLALTGAAVNSPGGFVFFDGIIVPTASSLFEVRWAQNTSNANATVLKAGSYIEATKLP